MWVQLADNKVVRFPLMPLIEQVSLAWPIWKDGVLGMGCFCVDHDLSVPQTRKHRSHAIMFSSGGRQLRCGCGRGAEQFNLLV